MSDSSEIAAKNRIAILVNGKCQFDGRVIKGAESLAAGGFDVMVFAQAESGAEGLSQVNGVKYRRFPKRRTQEGVTLLQKGIFHKAPPTTLKQQFYDAVEDVQSLWKLATLLWQIRRVKIGRLSPKTQRRIILSAGKASNKKVRKPRPERPEDTKQSRHDGKYESVLTRYGVAVRAFGPSLIHSHDLDCLAAAADLSAVMGCPFVYDVHELETARQDRTNEESRARAAEVEAEHIRKASAVITVSDQLASRLNEIYGVHPLVMYNTPRRVALSHASNSLRQDLRLSDETPLAVYTGLITRNRGIERFMRKMSGVPDLHFALVGMANKNMASVFTKLSKNLDIAARVHLVPPVPYDEVPSYISSASFGVIPALAESDNQVVAAPNKLFEMIFAGLPILMADIPQRRSILEAYGDGVIFPDDPEIDLLPFIERIVARCKDTSWRSSCRSKAQAAVELIGWEKQMLVVDRLYAELLAHPVVSPS